MKNNFKIKLKRRGQDVYNKYFFNKDEILIKIINQIDNNLKIDESICQTVFNVSPFNMYLVYELITYYPNKLKEIKYLTDEIIKDFYVIYGETIEIMKQSKGKSPNNVRGKIANNVYKRVKDFNLTCDLNSEDIILVKNCPYLNVPLEYGNNFATNYSASLDRIDRTKGYVKDNIRIVSNLANAMKNCATKEELISFATNVLKIHI